MHFSAQQLLCWNRQRLRLGSEHFFEGALRVQHHQYVRHAAGNGLQPRRAVFQCMLSLHAVFHIA